MPPHQRRESASGEAVRATMVKRHRGTAVGVPLMGDALIALIFFASFYVGKICNGLFLMLGYHGVP